MKISNKAKEDFAFYFKNKRVFTFNGTLDAKHKAIKGNATALEAFYSIDTYGKNIGTKHTNLLNAILQTKAALNFQIKQWAQCRADGTLPLSEFIGGNNSSTLHWVNGEPKYYSSIVEQYNLPKWVVNAVEKQKVKFYICHL
jgi:hypothetical protein